MPTTTLLDSGDSQFFIHTHVCVCVYIYVYIFFPHVLVALGLHCCAWAFSSCSKWGLVFVVECGLLLFWWLLSLQSTGSRHVGSVVVAPRL